MKYLFTTIWASLKAAAVRTRTFAMKHKIATGIVVLAVIGAGYWGYTVMAAGNTGTEYVLGTVTKAPLQVTVTGSGQVAANDTLSLSPKASGTITEVNVTPGESVKAGTIVAEIDMTTAAEAVTSARQNLESAQISYQQEVTSSNTGVANDTTSLATAQTTNATTLATTYTNLPTVMTGLDGILHNLSTVSNLTAQQNIDAYQNLINTSESQQYHMQVAEDYTTAVAAYQNVQAEYAATDVNTLSPTQLEQLDAETLAADMQIETAVKDTLTYYNYVNNQLVSSHSTLTTQLASQISSLTSYQATVTGDDSSITNAQTSLVNAEQSIAQDTESSNGSDTPLTLQSALLNVQKAQASLDQAESDEEDYIVRAPFDGVIATVAQKKYDQGSSGTAIATLVTTEEYADLSLNETDAANVAVGQKATVTFDAIDGLTMNGTVAEVAGIGTVSQGVVTYDVKVAFDTTDSRIKPGMTAEATIITQSEDNAIQVPSAAIKTTNGSSYVEVATLTNASSTMARLASTSAGTRRARTATSTSAYGAGFGGGAGATSTASSTRAAFGSVSRSLTVPESEVTITNVPVVTGISNDTMTEITSGLKPGQFIVTQTTSAATTKTTTASSGNLLSSLFGGSRRTTGTTGTRTTGATGTTGAAAGGFGGGAGGFSGAGAGGRPGG